MGSTLEHGIYLPSEGEKNCYSGLANNWQAVDTNIGYVTALRQAIAGALHREIVESLPTTDIDPNCIYMILKATAQTSNIYDEYMYINSSWELIGDSQLDLSNYYTKQEVNQLPAVASGVTSTKVGNYDAHIANGDIHVTTADKTKWNNGVTQAYVLRYSSTAITDNSTIAYSTLDNTDNIKVSDKIIDSDGKIFSVVSIDSANETVTVGSALIDLALDVNVMHLSGNETKSGELTASKFISDYFRSNTGSIQIQSNGSNRSVSMFNGSSAGDGGGFWAYGKDSANGSDCRLQIYNTTKSRYERVDLVNSQFLPTPSGELDCGGTSNKWKSINGLNPGALSLPDLSNGIDISGYITNLSKGVNTYTPPSNGWLSIRVKKTSLVHTSLVIYQTGGLLSSCETTEFGISGTNLPVIANQKVEIYIIADSLASAKFYPCLGNV